MSTEEDELRAALCAHNVPAHIHRGILDYVFRGQPFGGFLTAVFENNLTAACARADDDNRAHIFDLVAVVYNEVPSECWGSPEKVAAWRARGGLLGVVEERA